MTDEKIIAPGNDRREIMASGNDIIPMLHCELTSIHCVIASEAKQSTTCGDPKFPCPK